MANEDTTGLALSIMPEKQADFIYRKIEDETVLFNPVNNETYVLNTTASAIWEICDGSRSIEDITSVILRRFEANRAEMIKDIKEFIRGGLRDGYIIISEISSAGKQLI